MTHPDTEFFGFLGRLPGRMAFNLQKNITSDGRVFYMESGCVIHWEDEIEKHRGENLIDELGVTQTTKLKIIQYSWK